jgi:D-alanyl-D-alanine carboxypeptidase
MQLIRRMFALSLALAALPAAAQNPEAGLAAMRSRLISEPGYAGVFGVAYGPSVSLGALGNIRSGQPHEAGEAFRWASVSKMITAILVLQQVDEGRLALDAPIRAYLPDARVPNADRITIRQLLAHRSGLAAQADTPNGPPGELVQYCLATAADPGSTFLYNNCDTIVLGEVLETVSGASYLALVNQRIGAPLGFAVTLPDEPRIEARMEDGSAEPPTWPSSYGAAGGLYGTAEDLLKVDIALMEGRLISATSLATMLAGDPQSGYAALSVWSYSPDLKGCIGKTRLVERYGEIGGVQVRNFLLPDLGIALTVYSNDQRTNFGEVWRGEGLSVDLIRAAACGAAV